MGLNISFRFRFQGFATFAEDQIHAHAMEIIREKRRESESFDSPTKTKTARQKVMGSPQNTNWTEVAELRSLIRWPNNVVASYDTHSI